MRARKVFLAVLVLILAASAGLLWWARSVLGGDAVRRAVEAQLSRALGQPVAISSVDAGIFPRLTMHLRDVTIGDPARIAIAAVHVGTDLRALLSRRIEHGAVRLAGARIALPLPPLAIGAGGGASGGAPVEIVSIDAIELTGAEVVSGGRTVRIDVEAVPTGRGVDVRRLWLTADGAAVEITGAIANLSGPAGQLTVSARALDVLGLVAFATDFSGGLATRGRPASPQPDAVDDVPMDLQIAIEADRATVGTLLLDRLSGRARLTAASVLMQPIQFGVFGGTYSGTLAFVPADRPAFHVKASLSDLDVATAMAFAGSGNSVTGRLSGTIDVTGRGTTGPLVVSSARGRARLEVANGTVAGLNLVRAIVLAGSGRADSQAQVRGVPASRPEPFDSLTATLAIGGGVARTEDLEFRSSDVRLTGAGVIELESRKVDLVGRVQLSEALSAQAGRDLLRYTREDGRVTLPVIVSGTPGNLTVTLDVGDAARRAIVNRAAEEARKAISRAIGRIIK